jgi:hypothetical protein
MPTYNTLPAPSKFFNGDWYDKLIEDLRLDGLAKRTVYGYVRAIRKLADYHQKSPDDISENDVRAYLLHQIVDLEVASGTQSVILSAIKFFYRTTLPRQWKVLDQTKINYASALPEVITQRQVFLMIDACRTFRMKCFIWVNIKPVGDGGAVLKYLAPYVYRVAISDNRIVSVNEAGVTYQVKPSGKRQYQTRHLDGESFVRCFAQHILPTGFRKIRYYGFLSPNCKVQLADARWLAWIWRGWTYWLGSAMFQAAPIRRRGPTCKRCGKELEIEGVTDGDGNWLWRRDRLDRGPPTATNFGTQTASK